VHSATRERQLASFRAGFTTPRRPLWGRILRVCATIDVQSCPKIIMRLLLISIFLLFGLCARAAEPLNVAAAISMKESLQEIAKTLRTTDRPTHRIHLRRRPASSWPRSRNGAPIDAFISARRQNKSMTSKRPTSWTPKPAATSPATRLVLIVPASAHPRPPADGFGRPQPHPPSNASRSANPKPSPPANTPSKS